jgi:hypothetical protein
LIDYKIELTVKKLSLFLSALIITSAFFYSCDKRVGLLPTAPAAAPIAGSACDSMRFSVEIKPILVTYCAVPGCHDATTKQNFIDFSNYNDAKAQALGGRIKIRAIDPSSAPMPATGLIPQSERDKLQCWINNGALQ